MEKLLILHCTLLFAVLSCCVAEKIIIDTDGGADDAQAILMLLQAEADKASPSPFEIVAITCTYGNTELKNVEINVLKVLTIANRSNIPVYSGAAKPLIGNFKSDGYFGKDGFGDAPFNKAIAGTIIRSKHAAYVINELSKQYTGDISVIVLGPTTNVGLAISLDPELVNRVKRFHVMGSSIHGYGFYRPNVEFNFAADPEGNHILLNSSTSAQKLTIFPWEAAFLANSSITWRKQVFGNVNSPFVQFMNLIEALTLDRGNEDVYAPADTMAVATMLQPALIIQSTYDTRVKAVLSGEARGSVLVDFRPEYMHDGPANARIIEKIDAVQFEQYMMYLFSCKSVEC